MGAPNNTLVCFAVKEEAAIFRQGPRGASVEILITGMGPKNARRTVHDVLRDRRFRLVLSCGFAGALSPNFKVGDVLFDEDPAAGLGDTLRSIGATPARFHGSERVVVTAVEKSGLHRTTGADAVEMESSVIRAVCRERGIASATVRVISDAANEDLPLDFNSLMNAEERISVMKLAGAILRSPRSVPRLMQLQRDTKLAAGRLAEVLNGLLSRVGSGSGRAGS